jgi:hypothetical protein
MSEITTPVVEMMEAQCASPFSQLAVTLAMARNRAEAAAKEQSRLVGADGRQMKKVK